MDHALGNIISMYTIMLASFAFQRIVPFSVETVNNLVFYLFLPAAILYSIAKMPSLESKEFFIIIFICFCIILITLIVARLVGKRLHLPAKQLRTFTLGSAFGNYGFLGLPVVNAALGQQGLVYAVYFLIGSYLFLYTAGFYLMTGRVSPAALWKNPLLIATAGGMILLAVRMEFHPWLDQTLGMMTAATFPLSMVVVGGGLSLKFLSAFKAFKVPAAAVFLKLCTPAAAAYLLCTAFRLEPLQTGACILQSAMPTGVLVTVFSIRYKGDEALSNAIVSVSTLAGLTTLPFWSALLLNIS
jgi:malate permease and related proteins